MNKKQGNCCWALPKAKKLAFGHLLNEFQVPEEKAREIFLLHSNQLGHQ
jgi:hypothetical protein